MTSLKRNESGKALLELALVLPFLLLIGMSTLEALTNSRYREELSALKRAIGRDAFPRCLIERTDPNVERAAVETCLREVVNGVLPGAGSPIAGVQTVVTVWKDGFALGPYPDLMVGRVTIGGATSQFPRARLDTMHSFRRALPGELVDPRRRKRFLVTVEVYYSRTPYVPAFSGDYYESLII